MGTPIKTWGTPRLEREADLISAAQKILFFEWFGQMERDHQFRPELGCRSVSGPATSA
jgi:hypothetical protein